MDGPSAPRTGQPPGRPHRWMATGRREATTESRLQADSPSRTWTFECLLRGIPAPNTRTPAHRRICVTETAVDRENGDTNPAAAPYTRRVGLTHLPDDPRAHAIGSAQRAAPASTTRIATKPTPSRRYCGRFWTMAANTVRR